MDESRMMFSRLQEWVKKREADIVHEEAWEYMVVGNKRKWCTNKAALKLLWSLSND